MMAVRTWGSTFAWELVGPFLNDRLTACEGGDPPQWASGPGARAGMSKKQAVAQKRRREGRETRSTKGNVKMNKQPYNFNRLGSLASLPPLPSPNRRETKCGYRSSKDTMCAEIQNPDYSNLLANRIETKVSWLALPLRSISISPLNMLDSPHRNATQWTMQKKTLCFRNPPNSLVNLQSWAR